MVNRLAMMGVVLVAGSFLLAADKDKEDGQAFLGIYMSAPEDGQTGVTVLKAIEDSPAEAAGLQKGDVLIRFDGRTVDNLESFVHTVRSASPGDEVVIDLIRDGREEAATVVLTEKPDQEFVWKGKNVFKLHRGEGDHNVELFFSDEDDNEKVHSRILGLIGDHEGGKIEVNVECDDGVGTVTIDRDGEITTETFDCDEEGHAFKKHHVMVLPHGMPHVQIEIPEIEIPDIDIDIPDLKEHVRHQTHGFAWHGKATREFEVDEDGTISVVVRKGGNRLTQVFGSEEELKAKSPDLYEIYTDLQKEMDK